MEPEIFLPPASQADVDLLFSATYEELRRLAMLVRRNDPASTLTPTTLVHEAWIKLAKSPGFAAMSRLHFKQIAARAMRQLLVEAARRRRAEKRGGDQALFVTFDDARSAPAGEDELVALDAALQELAKLNPRQALMIETRYFGGLEVHEVAELLGVSEATIHRDWRVAKAWLARELRRGG